MTLRLGLIGAGIAGERHAAAARALDGVTLGGVADLDPARAAGLSARFGAAACAPDALMDRCDALVIATPATSHARLALAALAAGRHVLVERPVATSRADAEAMVAAARAGGRVLHVGHREAALMSALGLDRFRAGLTRFRAVREVLPREHVADVGVVLDLMVQDLFVAAGLFGVEPVAVKALKLAGRTGILDAAEAQVRFRGGATAEVRASRVASVRTVSWSLTHGDGAVGFDFVRRVQSRTDAEGVGRGRTRDMPLQDFDPVAQNLRDFVAAIRGEAPAQDPGPALRALDLALHVEMVLEGAA